MNTNARRLEALLKKQYGTRYRKGRGKNGTEYRICCPFCVKEEGKEDKKYKMYLNPEVDRYYCFRCGSKGAVSTLFSDIRSMADEPFIRLPPTPLPSNVEPPGVLHPLSELDEENAAITYLRGRGFNPDVLEKYYGVRYCSRGHKISGIFDTTNTIVFPLWMNGALVGWQARLLYSPDKLNDAECAAMGYMQDADGKFIRPPKYFTAPGVDKGRVMFNYDMARASEVIVISEGPMDAIAIGPCAVATLGKGVTDQQARLVKAYWRIAVTLLDPGDADRESRKLQGALWDTMPVINVRLSGFSDPGEADTLSIWNQIYTEAANIGIDLMQFNLGPHMKEEAFKR
jgi:hypothetical protein